MGTQVILAASTSQHQAVPMWEKPTLLLTGSLVRIGRTHTLINTATPMWEITTSVGILLGQISNTKCGVLALILAIGAKIVQFPFAPP